MLRVSVDYVYLVSLIIYMHMKYDIKLVSNQRQYFYHEKCLFIRMIQLPIVLKYLRNGMLCLGESI